MWGLHDIRESKVWQEAYAEGFREGLEESRSKGSGAAREQLYCVYVRRWLDAGKSWCEIAALLHSSVAEVRRLASQAEVPDSDRLFNRSV